MKLKVLQLAYGEGYCAWKALKGHELCFIKDFLLLFLCN